VANVLVLTPRGPPCREKPRENATGESKKRKPDPLLLRWPCGRVARRGLERKRCELRRLGPEKRVDNGGAGPGEKGRQLGGCCRVARGQLKPVLWLSLSCGLLRCCCFLWRRRAVVAVGRCLGRPVVEKLLVVWGVGCRALLSCFAWPQRFGRRRFWWGRWRGVRVMGKLRPMGRVGSEAKFSVGAVLPGLLLMRLAFIFFPGFLPPFFQFPDTISNSNGSSNSSERVVEIGQRARPSKLSQCLAPGRPKTFSQRQPFIFFPPVTACSRS
jgi:hypothetical protein